MSLANHFRIVCIAIPARPQTNHRHGHDSRPK